MPRGARIVIAILAALVTSRLSAAILPDPWSPLAVAIAVGVILWLVTRPRDRQA